MAHIGDLGRLFHLARPRWEQPLSANAPRLALELQDLGFRILGRFRVQGFACKVEDQSLGLRFWDHCVIHRVRIWLNFSVSLMSCSNSLS